MTIGGNVKIPAPAVNTLVLDSTATNATLQYTIGGGCKTHKGEALC